MSIKYEYYDTGDTSWTWIWSDNWQGQTFTPQASHKITSVKLLLYRSGLPGYLTISIQGVDGNDHPDGIEKCSGTTDGDTLTEDTDGEWREITLGAGCNLDADTKYAIVAKALDGSSGNDVRIRYDGTDATYTRGAYEYSTDGGESWDTVTLWDFMFEEWGEEIAEAVGRSYGFIIG